MFGMFVMALIAQTPAAAPAQFGQTRQQFENMLGNKWKRIDTSGDGVITVEEWIAARAKPDQPAEDPARAAKALTRLDLDKDGRLQVGEGVEGERARFDRMDVNKDGIVTPDEKANENRNKNR